MEATLAPSEAHLVTLGADGQIKLPADFLASLSLQEGDSLGFAVGGDGQIKVWPVWALERDPIYQCIGMLNATEGPSTLEEIRAWTHEIRGHDEWFIKEYYGGGTPA